MIVTILDPGNTIFKMKEMLFILTFLLGLLEFKNFLNWYILISSFSFSLMFPLMWLFFGYVFNFNFSLEYGLMYLKAFVFFLLINVTLDTRIDFSKLFVATTFLLIPITTFLYFFIGEFKSVEMVFLDFKETFVISKRAFGGFVFDPVIFYKTSPLLIFGLSYLCQINRFKYLIFNAILIILCLFTLVISGTRANMMASVVILFYFFYKNYFTKNKAIKILFWLSSALCFIVFLIPFLGTYVFDTYEQSNQAKLNIINDYFYLWSNNIYSIPFGQGLGGGFNTIERGMSYMVEPTYFEIIRMFGVIGGAVILLFLVLPLFLFSISKSSNLYTKYQYLLIAYILYLLIEIPSNPLLLSSTGMLIMVVVYSTSIKVYLTRHLKKQITS